MARNCQSFPFLADSSPFESMALNVVRERTGTRQREELVVAKNSERPTEVPSNPYHSVIL